MSMSADHKPMPVNEETGEVEVITPELEEARSYSDLSRRDIRALIFHYLYAAEAYDYDVSLDAIVDNFNRGFEWDVPLNSEAVEIAQAVIGDREALDKIYEPLLTNWRFDRVSVCTKLILRLAIWELQHTDTDPRIIINEAIELAKCFAEKDAFRFINGILDKAVKQVKE
ncbi:MAG TPA: transcription antitermination factor NusB [Candidatus Dependentiae bacterium]|nr:transcription antitermination factor NusB [Candidatus Dependentiae bacterium]HRQ63144.1 transcription antitermination factor NusB [Candidatus Dependentiae bacterium]